MEINHSGREHALLSASGAYRWMSCTLSARLEEKYGEPDKPSAYAAEGTVAHELAELYLRKDILQELDDATFNDKLAALMDSEYFNDEMFEEVPKYVDYCEEQYRAAQTETPDAAILIEQKVDLTQWIPEAFGSNDCIIITDGHMEVIDLKYGKGIPVSAIANKQLMLYALGAYAIFSILYDIQSISLTIVQPRLNNISTWNITVVDLLNWGEKEVKPRALIAFEGKGELVPGEHCRFCKVKNRCRALMEENMKIAQHEFAEPDLLSDEEIADILQKAPQFIEWINSITTYAQEQAISNGKNWPGFKLVEGRATRKWLDENKVEEILRANNFGTDEIFEMKLKGLTAMQKLLGKQRFEALLGDAITRPQGKPTLVPIDDKRPALGTEDAVNDFKE